MSILKTTFVAEDTTIVLERLGNVNKVTVMDDGRKPIVRFIPLNHKGVKRMLRTRGVMVFLGDGEE